jgi:outer membrane protein
MALAVAAAAGSVGAQSDAKIGFINSKRIFMEYSGYEDARTAYQKELDGWLQDLQTRQDEITRMESEYRAQEPMLSEERRRERETELQRAAQEFEQLRQTIFGVGGRAEVRNQQLLEPVEAVIQAAVQRIAEDEGYDLIFDATDGNIIYGDPRFDITERVLDELGAGPAEAAPGGATPEGQTPGGGETDTGGQ